MHYTSITKEIYLKLLLSTFVIQFSYAVSFFLDFIIPGSFLGEEALSVITLVMPLLLLAGAFTETIAIGGSTAFTEAIGAGKPDEAQRYLTATLLGSLLSGLFFILLGWIFLDPLVGLLGADKELFDLTRQVTQLSLLYFLSVPFLACLDFFARNDGRMMLSSLSNIVCMVGNIILSIYLIGYTSMGIIGAPISALIASLIGFLILLPVFFDKNSSLHFSRQTTYKDFFHIMRLGSGLSTRNIYQGTSTLIFNNFLMNFCGPVGVVAYGIVLNVQELVFCSFTSIRECIQPLISSYIGERNHPGICETIKSCRTTGILVCLFCWLFFELMPASFLHIFGIYDEASLAVCLEAIHIYAFVFPFLCFTEVISSYYLFIGYPRMTFYILTAKGLALLLPISLLGFWLCGLKGLWMGFIASEILSCIYCLLLARRKAMRSNPRLSPVLLLDRTLQHNRLFLDIPLSQKLLLQAMDQIEHFLQKNKVSPDTCSRIRLCLEEIGLNILQYNPDKKNIRIEIQLHIEESVRLTIRDNCTAFNTKNSLQHKKNPDQPHFGLSLVNRAANEFTYVPTIGYNRTILIFSSQPKR